MKDANKNSGIKRLFIAIPLPDALKEKIDKKVKCLGAEDSVIKFVPGKNIHITLKFLGNTRADRVNKIQDAIKLTTERFNKFHYTIAGSLDAFPSLRTARVIFLPVIKGESYIEEIFSELETNLNKIKIRKEHRKFTSHITVARLKIVKDITEQSGKVNTGDNCLVLCSHITLYESILKPSGAEYNIINEFELK